MSICRYAKTGQPSGFFGGRHHDAESASDVYMYEHVHGFIACQECKLGGSQDHEPGTVPFVKLISYDAAHKHLLAHKAAGHAVPQGAIKLCKESAESGEKLEPSLCEVPGCGNLWTHGYPAMTGGVRVYHSRCDTHHDAVAAKTYDDWIAGELRS